MRKHINMVCLITIVCGMALTLTACGRNQDDEDNGYDYYYWSTSGNDITHGTSDNGSGEAEYAYEPEVVAVFAGDYGSFVLKSDGSLWGWGFLRLTGGDEERRSWGWREPPRHVMNDISDFSTGTLHSLAIDTNGALWAWGRGMFGDLYEGGKEFDRMNPQFIPVHVMDDVIGVSAGSASSNVLLPYYSSFHAHALAITSDGILWGWGYNSTNQIIDGGEFVIDSPIEIMNNVVSAAAGNLFSMALTANGDLWVWGHHDTVFGGKTRVMNNVIAIYTTTVPAFFFDFDAPGTPTSDRMYAITYDGTLWGWNVSIDGNPAVRYRPIEIMSDVIGIAAGQGHTMAITADGSLWGWGCNNYGQIGVHELTDHNSPVHVYAVSNVVSAAAGRRHTVVLTEDGEVLAWGSNAMWQVGPGEARDMSGREVRKRPRQVVFEE